MLASWRAGYEVEREKYARAHRSKANILLHAVLSPLEWVAALVVVHRLTSSTVVWAIHVAVVCGTAMARPPATIVLAAPQVLFAPAAISCAGAPPAQAVAVWVASMALQVVVGHGMLDRTAPSAVKEPLAFQSVFLNVAITWDLGR